MSYSRVGVSGGSRFGVAGRVAGVLAAIAGVLGAGYLLAVLVLPYLFSDGGSLAVANAPTILVWSVAIVGVSVGIGYWAWTKRVRHVWVLAAAVSVFSVLSLFSIGRVVVPFAVLSVVAALLLTVERRTAEH